MRERLQRFFIGRNGADDLCRFLNLLSIVLLILGIFTFRIFSSFGIAFYVYSMFRMLSRNQYKRSMENSAYLQLRGRAQGWFSRQRSRFAQRKTHRYFKCPNCKQTVRVPKGKGRISITCPQCRTQFQKTS